MFGPIKSAGTHLYLSSLLQDCKMVRSSFHLLEYVQTLAAVRSVNGDKGCLSDSRDASCGVFFFTHCFSRYIPLVDSDSSVQPLENLTS